MNANKKILGTYKKYKNFNFVTIYGSGHMVPKD